MAVSLAGGPIAMCVRTKQKSAQQHTQAGNPVVQPAASSASAAAGAAAAPAPKMSFGKALGLLTLLGLASPFLALSNPTSGIIGLVILLVGIRIAWQLTAAKTLEISGPLDPEPAPAAAR